MNVQVKSSSGISLVPAESLLLTDRKIFLEGEINANTACDFAKQIMVLNKEDNQKPINVFINSLGGEINAGMLIYDVIQSSGAPVLTYCMGKAYSMAAVIFACGLHGRYMLPHAELMLHEPLLGSGIEGNASSIQSISESLIETKRMMNLILAKHTGKTFEQLEKASSYDHYFSAEESLDFGLCDEIINFDKILQED